MKWLFSVTGGNWNALKQWSPTFLAPGSGFLEDNFSTDQSGGDGFGMSQAHTFKLTSGCVAWFLTGPDQYWSAAWMLGIPALKEKKKLIYFKKSNYGKVVRIL